MWIESPRNEGPFMLTGSLKIRRQNRASRPLAYELLARPLPLVSHLRQACLGSRPLRVCCGPGPVLTAYSCSAQCCPAVFPLLQWRHASAARDWQATCMGCRTVACRDARA